jgi:hypothetical protein
MMAQGISCNADHPAGLDNIVALQRPFLGRRHSVGLEGMMPFLKGRPRYLTAGVTTGKEKFPCWRAFFFSQTRTRNHGNFLIKIYFKEVQTRTKKVDG